VIGALVGKAASDGRPVQKAVRRATAASKGALKRHPGKKSAHKLRKTGGRRLRSKTTKKGGSKDAATSRKRTARASRKSIRSRPRSTLPRARPKRRPVQAKRR
jgi:hypothetical protein